MRLLCALFSTTFAMLAASAPVSYHKDMERLIQKHCQECHRPGEIGPMPLLTFQQVRPWAKAIKAAVLNRSMPPWDADPHYGVFSNDRSMSEREIKSIVAWVDAGAPEGSLAEAPKPRTFAAGWRMGNPDIVFEMPKEFHVPASGTIPYQWIKIPSGFKEDTWIEAIEVRPGNPAVLHHAVVYAREPEVEYGMKAPYGEFFLNPIDNLAEFRSQAHNMFSTTLQPEHLQVFAPGADPIVLKPGQARLIKAGADIIFEMHYTTNGKAQSDRSRVGLILAKKRPLERVRTIRLNNGVPISIPPGEANYRLESRVEALDNLKIVSFMPHMHLRGKAMEFRATYPDGKTEVLLSVPRYRFQWQMTYYLAEPKVVPKGTVLTCVAVYDNSANNPNNPDPTKRVPGGLQSWEEMMAGFVDFAIAPAQSLDLFRNAPTPESGAAPADGRR
ncbi:MAG: thiol-disulfide isomerase [Bryobacteraceae bacterium]